MFHLWETGNNFVFFFFFYYFFDAFNIRIWNSIKFSVLALYTSISILSKLKTSYTHSIAKSNFLSRIPQLDIILRC